jgi:outer membrane protein OmpA-like peptidoglycan-associated protein
MAVFVLGAPACGGNDRPAQDATASATTSQEATGESARDRETTVQISAPLRERCSIPGAESAPAFDYDQATLRARGRNVLDDVAACLKDGALKGEVITIVGRADARGAADYNRALSESRAAAARNYLVQAGVPAERVKLLARGEEGARGSDEATWALDRRVDLELGDVQNSPILKGSMLQAETANKPDNSPEAQKASSYADVADGAPATSTKGGTTAGPSK